MTNNADDSSCIPNNIFSPNEPSVNTAQDFARHHLMVALSRMGYSIRSFEEAWGQLVAIQAEIAADPDNGSKATSAIKFVAEAIGISNQNDKSEIDTLHLFPDLSIEEAQNLLAWISNNPIPLQSDDDPKE